MRRFPDANPIAVTIYTLCAALCALFSQNPALMCLFLIGSVFFFLLHCPGKGGHGLSILLFLTAALINPLISHRGVTVLFVMNHNPVTLEALYYGLFTGSMILSSLYWFRAYSQIMTSDKLLYLFGALSPKLSLVLSMALRYVPLFGLQIRKVQEAQTAAGLYKDDNLPDRIRGGMRIFSVMVTWALENGITTADSMTARGYGLQKRSRYSLFKWTGSDTALTVCTLLLTGATLMGLSTQTFTFYPAIKSSPLSPAAWTCYGCYALLMLLPFLIHLKEAIKWRCLTSGM